MSELAAAPLRDWELLSSWLRAEWKETDPEEHPFHAGLREAYSMIGRMMRDSPPEEREGRLYQFLAETLSAGKEPTSE